MKFITLDITFIRCMIAELVVAELSKKVGHSGGIESTGRVEVGDVVTAISMNKEEMKYLSVGPQKIQHQRALQVYSMLKQARGNIHLQVERYKNEVTATHLQPLENHFEKELMLRTLVS